MPISLEVAQRFVPGVEFDGVVNGVGEVRGTPRELRAELALWLPTGSIDIDGTFDLAADVPTYNAFVEFNDVDAQSIVAVVARLRR